ncbi:MAG: DUF1684 domain-containing protein [Acidobacteria bacterium]|nr:DUF1684 domain-containing protein [Acidobacteriota bacterium]
MRGLVVLWPAILMAADSGYIQSVEQWRRQAEIALRADDGWLTVSGLFWLKPGENGFGSAESNAIVLPAPAPPQAGAFHLEDGQVTLRAHPQSGLTLGGQIATSQRLASDATGKEDIVQLGSLAMFVIVRGERIGIRLRDLNSKYRRQFTGRQWFEVKPEYRVEARFEPHAAPRQVKIPNILGDTETMTSSGVVVFTLNGREHRLEPVDAANNRLWFILRDKTSGKSTYPAGRFLYADAPRNGKVMIDFNQAYNPPCAFTPYATCPLPPRQNHLDTAVEAGELNYHTEP